MLDAAQRTALLAARHADPFAVLGLHADADGQQWLRALLPGATSVLAIDAANGSSVAALTCTDPGGLFEAAIPPRGKRLDYRLRVDWHTGARTEHADAYAFGPQLAEHDLHALRAGKHPDPYTVLGAHAMAVAGVDGVRFALWAPNARRVSVVGSFNQWDGRRHPMRLRHDAGVWEIFIPAAALGDQYQFELLDAHGHLLPAKADPYARAAELRPGTASRVTALPPATALPHGRIAANQRDAPIAIYEVHAGSWRRGAHGGFASWDELAATLPAYAADMGFTHLELMPITEHPFDGSWGYQTLGLFAPSARFGPPEGFARFVAACHARGLGLLLDWVPAHFPADSSGLARFDGSTLYEYADPREGRHQDWDTLIYDFGRHEVRNFLEASACYWVERWGVDGLRVDAVASMLYRDYSRAQGQWVPNVHGGRENLEAIALLQQVNIRIGATAGALSIAEESTTYSGVSAPVHAGGLGFHFKWNMGWMNDTLRYMREDPLNRRWHHHQMTFGLVYAFSENFVLPISHDEVVHGKGSMLGRMPGDEWQRFANLRAYYGFMWGHPGKKLLFMGQEFAQPHEWQHDHALPWALCEVPLHAGVQRLVRDLNQAYRGHPALHRLDHDGAGFRWLVGDDAQHCVLAWMRYDDSGQCAIVACNFTPLPRAGYRIDLPEDAPRQWREILNTDARRYGGSGLGNGSGVLASADEPHHRGAHALHLSLPPLATIFLVPA
jgi:1,4-alpha-glucan branching enzyme